MKITTSQINEKKLTKFGFQVTELIKEHKYKKLENRFGYALAFSESPAGVIQNRMWLLNFLKKTAYLIAVVECTLVIENGVGEMLAELIVAGTDTETHLSLEQISYQA